MKRIFLIILSAATPALGWAMTVTMTGTPVIGQTPLYQITGAPASCSVVWDGWFAPLGGSSSQVIFAYPNGNTDASGNASIPGGTWTSGTDGNWTIQATACGQSAQTSFTISPAFSAFSLNAASLTFLATVATAPGPQSVVISNTGSGGPALNWSVSSDASWLLVSPPNGGPLAAAASQSVTVTVQSAVQPAGHYVAHLTFTANALPTQMVTVTMDVVLPGIGLGASVLNFATMQGVNPADQMLTIANSGAAGSTLNWSAASSATSWLSVPQANGSLFGVGTSQSIPVHVQSASLAPGNYSGNLSFSASGIAPQVVSVNLTVNGSASPNLVVNTNLLNFSATQGSANPAAQSVMVTNTGTAASNWTASSNAGWLTVNPSVGALNAGGNQSLTVNAVVGALGPGNYNGTLTFSDQSGAPKMLTVNLTVNTVTGGGCHHDSDCGANSFCQVASPSNQCLPYPAVVTLPQPTSGGPYQPADMVTFEGVATSPNAAAQNSYGTVVWIGVEGSHAGCSGTGAHCLASVPVTTADDNQTVQVMVYAKSIDNPLLKVAVVMGPVLHVQSPGVSVSITPSAASVRAGESRQFNAVVTGTPDPSVVWTINPPLGTLSAAGLYRAPGGLTAPQTVMVTATSVADPSKSAQSSVALSAYSIQSLDPPSSVDELLGVTDWGGTYRLSSQGTQLEEEAQEIQDMGSDTIYVALSYNYQTAYLNSNFGGSINSLRDLAQSGPFKNVFNRPFKTYLLATFSFSNQSYMTQPNLAGEYQEMKDLVTTLLQTYAGTGKTFIIKNWEGDNALAEQEGCDLPQGCASSLDIKNFTPHPSDLQNMIDWFNVRQEAIKDARQATGSSGVKVLQAAEFNLVSRAKAGQISVLSSVVPKVDTDLISYSSYETINVGRTNLQSQILADIGFIRSVAGINGRQLLIGEFGWPNLAAGFMDADVRTTIAAQAFFDSGVARASYWALYDNGSGQSLIDSAGRPTPVGDTVKGLTTRIKNTALTAAVPNANALTPASVIQLGSSGPVLQVNWAVLGQGSGSATLHASAAPSSWGSTYSDAGILRVQTPGPQLDLGPLALSPGSYHIQAYAKDSSGGVSAPVGFDIILVNASVPGSGMSVFPNPWKATTALKKEVTFDGLSGHSTIKIFTVSGYSVQVLSTDSATAAWDLRNRDGQDVASGIYLYSITNNLGDHARGKLVLIR